ncbi:MAG: HAD family hydrolase [Bacteroidota bacterium]
MDLLDRKLLILDLDETLIHATENRLNHLQHDLAFDKYFVYKRPHVESLLTVVNAHYDIAIWSSADDDYVDAIVSALITPHVDLKFVWGRSRCTMRKHFDLDRYVWEKHLKKVKKLDYRLEHMLIVDDSQEKVNNNYGNAIYIKPFEGDTDDMELIGLGKYLLSIKEVPNFRRLEKRGWSERY